MDRNVFAFSDSLRSVSAKAQNQISIPFARLDFEPHEPSRCSAASMHFGSVSLSFAGHVRLKPGRSSTGYITGYSASVSPPRKIRGEKKEGTLTVGGGGCAAEGKPTASPAYRRYKPLTRAIFYWHLRPCEHSVALLGCDAMGFCPTRRRKAYVDRRFSRWVRIAGRHVPLTHSNAKIIN